MVPPVADLGVVSGSSVPVDTSLLVGDLLSFHAGRATHPKPTGGGARLSRVSNPQQTEVAVVGI